jgi:hypothetical protein
MIYISILDLLVITRKTRSRIMIEMVRYFSTRVKKEEREWKRLDYLNLARPDGTCCT